MRKVIVANIMSLDGYYTGPGDDVMVMPFDDSFNGFNAERLRAADTVLLGRVSYEGFRSYWPMIADNPDVTPEEREISRMMTAIEKVVVSDSLALVQPEPWPNTRVIRRAEAPEQIAALKRQPGRDILIFGSQTLWTDLLANGLVDELHVTIGAGVIGAGRPLFANRAANPLRLLETRAWSGGNNVVLRYGVGPLAGAPA